MQPPSGPQARADVEERCHLAAARQHSRRRELLRPGRRSRSGCGAPPGAGRRCARLAASCWPSAMRSTLLSSMSEVLQFLRQTAPQLELTGSAGLVVSQRLADAADGLREGPGRPSADGWCRMEFAHHLDICIASRSRLQPHGHSNQAERSGRPIRICMRWCSYDAGDGHDLLPPDLPPMPVAASA